MNRKIVRDRIPEIIKAAGLKPKVTQVPESDVVDLLKEKLLEEVEEFKSAEDLTHQYEELADILEVVFALGDRLGTNQTELEKVRLKKFQERGSFTKGYVLEKE